MTLSDLLLKSVVPIDTYSVCSAIHSMEEQLITISHISCLAALPSLAVPAHGTVAVVHFLRCTAMTLCVDYGERTSQI